MIFFVTVSKWRQSWKPNNIRISSRFEITREVTRKSKKGFPPESSVKRSLGGIRTVNGGKELLEKFGRNDFCPCSSNRRFQELLHAHRWVWRLRASRLLQRLKIVMGKKPASLGSLVFFTNRGGVAGAFWCRLACLFVIKQAMQINSKEPIQTLASTGV